MAKHSKATCECADPGCVAHPGRATCSKPATAVLYRVDMDDMSGTRFCDWCEADAYGSGLFTDGRDDDDMDGDGAHVHTSVTTADGWGAFCAGCGDATE